MRAVDNTESERKDCVVSVNRLNMATRALIGVSLAALVAACSSGSSPSPSTSAASEAPSSNSSPSAAPELGTFAYVLPFTSNPYFVLAQCGAQAKADELGVKISWQGPTGLDLQVESQALDAAIAANAEAILLVALDPEAMAASAKKAKELGIPTFSWDTVLGGDVAVQTVRTDSKLGGVQAADYLGEKLNGKGTVIIQGSLAGNPTHKDRADGFVEELAAKYPDIKVLPIQYTLGEGNKAATTTAALAQANPDVNAAYTVSNGDLPGTLAGLKTAGVKGATIVAWDADENTLKALNDGTVAALVVQDPKTEAATTLQNAYDLATGKTTEDQLTKDLLLPTKIVTKDNVNSPEVQSIIKC